MKDWTPEEAGLLDEMKGRCLNKGLYIDKNAEAKFKMLCHLEDYGICYYELKSRIDKAVEYIENDLKSFLYSIEYKTLLNILNGGDE